MDPHLPRAVLLIAAGPLEREAELLDWLGGALHDWLGAPVHCGEPLELRDEWWSREREQLNSNQIVDALIERDEPIGDSPPDEWKLAVTEADLFAPGRTFVFGEAAQGGAWAVVALARLREDLDSSDPEALLRRRLFKEVVHELGHVAGLGHCDRSDCVMFPSEDLADTDRKSSSLCPACSSDLDGVLPIR